MAICYLGLGTNLGKRQLNIRLAIKKITLLKNTRVLKQSKIIQTLPVGGPLGQPKYLNAALKISTEFRPLVLLEKLKNIEKELGRKETKRFGARIIDLDILLYDDLLLQSKRLTIPHPRMFRREFVIKPLLEVLC